MVFVICTILAGLTYPCISFAHKCEQVVSSEPNIALTGFVFKSFSSTELWACFTSCTNDSLCQSINYDLQTKICQFNKETKTRQPSNVYRMDSSIYMDNPYRAKLGSRELPARSCRHIRELADESRGNDEYWIDPMSTQQPFRVYCIMDGEQAATDCQAIHQRHPSSPSGLYYLDPDGGNHDNEYLAYCDMTSHGGGWTMCYTSNDKVKPKTEVTYDPKHPYGTNGYRTNCNNITFNEVMFINEDSPRKDSSYFRRQGGLDIKVVESYSNINAAPNGLWDGYGVASTSYQYQLLICDDNFYNGFFVSGFIGNCYKACGTWCGDVTSDYYRTASASSSMYTGVAFKENGHDPAVVSSKLMSAGIRRKN